MTPSPPNKRRRSEAGQLLGLNCVSERYAAKTSTQFYLNDRNIELDEGKAVRRHKKAREAGPSA